MPDGSYRRRVTGDELTRIVTDVLAEKPPYEVGRERVRSRIVRRIQEQAERRSGPRPASWRRAMERARPVSACVDELWPKVRPEELVHADWPDTPAHDGLHWKTRPLVAWAAGRPFVWLDDEITPTDAAWVAAHHPAPALLHRVDTGTASRTRTSRRWTAGSDSRALLPRRFHGAAHDEGRPSSARSERPVFRHRVVRLCHG